MAETTTNTNAACEQLLDYVYGELDEAGKRAFEEHLAGCARCQADVKSFGKVRVATKRLMPAVEPTGQLGGALHAQLMHAAAQHKPRRGVLLAFPRKIVEHPAWAAAAMFAIVGSAVALNWSRGKLAMPMAEKAEAPATATPTASPTVPAAPAAEPAVGEKNKEDAAKVGVLGALKGGKDSGGDTKLLLDAEPAGRLTVQRPATHHAVTTGAPAKMPAMKKVAKTKLPSGGLADDSLIVDGKSGEGAADKPRAASAPAGAGGAATRGADVAATEAEEKSSSPQSLSRAKNEDQSRYVASAPKPSPPAASAPTQSWPSNPRVSVQQGPVANTAPTPVMETPPAREQYRAKAQSSVQAPATPSRDIETLRKRAVDLATTGRCEEAIKAYQELEKRTSFISPTERIHYVRCLTALGREEQAQQALDELKSDKRVTNSDLQQAENELSNVRKQHEAKKAKKAAPADRRAYESQRRPAEPQAAPAERAPAQAAPPPRSDKASQKAY